MVFFYFLFFLDFGFSVEDEEVFLMGLTALFFFGFFSLCNRWLAIGNGNVWGGLWQDGCVLVRVVFALFGIFCFFRGSLFCGLQLLFLFLRRLNFQLTTVLWSLLFYVYVGFRVLGGSLCPVAGIKRRCYGYV